MTEKDNGAKHYLGFPKPLLGEESLRLELIANEKGFIALNKPSGIGVRQHPWDSSSAHLDGSLNAQLKDAKPELVSTKAKLFGSIYHLDSEISGVALFGKDKASIASLRNAFGSSAIEFKFLFIAFSADALEARIVNDTALMPHRTQNKMIPSSAKGKRSNTVFKRLAGPALGWGLWEAEAQLFRPHQVRLHASLSGLKLMGDTLYRGEPAPTYASVGKRKKAQDREAEIFKGLALHLEKVYIRLEKEPEVALCSNIPKSFVTALNYLNLA